jgi:catechol 2,3-dioxygenase-like lactoylglutathione lyase family enzyme
MEINGIAHVQFSVNDLERAMTFYERVLGFMGMTAVAKGSTGLYMVGGRTAVAISRASPEHLACRFDQRRIGLHHVCLRARSRDDVETMPGYGDAST